MTRPDPHNKRRKLKRTIKMTIRLKERSELRARMARFKEISEYRRSYA